MKYQTELMQAILTNEKAQEIIDYVSPIYGNSYVGLWMFQAIGTALGSVCDIFESLRKETNPVTAVLLLDMWEDHYAIPRNSSLTVEQRQARLSVKKQEKSPCNPSKMEAAISSAVGGAEVEIVENVAKNTFLVNIMQSIEDLTPAVAVIERMKPAHLIYQIRIAAKTVSDAEIKTAVALTHLEHNHVEVIQ